MSSFNDPKTRIADARRACIRNDRDILTADEAVGEFVGAFMFVVFVITR